MPATPKPKVAAAGEATVAFRLRLFVYHFDLFVDHSVGKPVDRHVNPVMLLPCNYKPVLKTCSVRRVAPALDDHIDQQVPSTRLIDFAKSPRDRFTLGLWNCRTQPRFIGDQIC